MSSIKFKRGLVSTEPIQTLTSASTGTRVTSVGTTVFNTTASGDKVWVLNKPGMKGLTKTIIADVNSTALVTVRVDGGASTSSTAGFLLGTTARKIEFSTGAVAPKRAILRAYSADQWMLVHSSTGVALRG